MNRRGDWSRASIQRDRERFERSCSAKDEARRTYSASRIAEHARLVASGMSPADAERTIGPWVDPVP